MSVLILSLGFLNHNFILGQLTILILWLTLEGLLQIENKKDLKGTALIALGINIKIIPALAIVYLFYKKKFKLLAYILVFFVISLLLPGIFLGYNNNKRLLANWKNVINPVGEKYMFENDDSHSLNALLPAFLYDFGEEDGGKRYGYNRKIVYLPYQVLVYILQGLRIILVLSILWFVRFNHKARTYRQIYFFWETGYLMLVTLLIFPHQMNYSMLYFVPAGAYILYFFLFLIEQKTSLNTLFKMTGILSIVCLILMAVMGRDLIGDHMVNLLTFFHIMGFINILYLVIFSICNPQILEKNAKLDRIRTI